MNLTYSSGPDPLTLECPTTATTPVGASETENVAGFSVRLQAPFAQLAALQLTA